MSKVGRIQCLIIGAIVVGFISFGKSFIVDVWDKPDFAISYWCTILLIIPSYFYLPMQIANTTVVVENKVKLQSMVFLIMGILNVCISLFTSKYWGALGASFSIFIAYMVRNILMVGIHIKVLKLNMKEFFKNSYLKITPYLLIMMGIGIVLENFNPMSYSVLRFIVNGGIFVCIFASTAYLFVLNSYEKNLCLDILNKILKKIRKAY